jgi:O-antigen/teichoic acid export membrane protein
MTSPASMSNVVTSAEHAPPDRLATSTALLIMRRGVLTVASGLSAVFVARVLHPGSYGALQSAIATWTLLSGLCDFGFSLALGRDFAANPRTRAASLRAAYEVQAVWSILLAVAAASVGLAAGPTTVRGMCLLVLAPSLIANSFTAGRALFVSTLDVGKSVKIDLFTNLSQIAATLGLAIGGGGAVGVAAAVSVGTALNAVWIGLAAARVTGRVPAQRGARLALIKRVAPLGFMAVMAKVYVSIDVALLGFFIGGVTLGEYAAAAKVLMLLNLIPAIVFSTALPGFAKAGRRSDEFTAVLERILHWLVAAVAPLFLFTALFSHLVLGTALGADYVGAAGMLSILAVAGLVGLASQTFGTALVAADLVRPLVWQNALVMVLNIGLNLWLIPSYGAYGSAWITVGTEAFVAVAAYRTARRKMGLVLPLGRCVRPTVVLLAASVTAVVPGLTPTVHAAVFLLVMSSGYLALHAWPKDLIPTRIAGIRRPRRTAGLVTVDELQTGPRPVDLAP